MTSAPLPPQHSINPEQLSRLPLPINKIRTDEDVEIWKQTTGYSDYLLFLQKLSNSVVGTKLPPEFERQSQFQCIQRLLSTLDEVDKWVDEIPPLQSPQRFGNLAFRTWGKRLEDRSDALLSSLLPEDLIVGIPQLRPYWLTSFGSFVRMDYGTGHETSFVVFLCVLDLIGYFDVGGTHQQVYRDLVLLVFHRYLTICWRIQDAYNLEPAGSHGVWGLDDSHFLPYVFGSAQLREETAIPVSAVLKPPLSPDNFYFLAISRIHQVKKGPFHEHSSQLYAIATGVTSWYKVEKGLWKMYQAEVLGKRVVVQHLPLGGVLRWDIDDIPSTPTPAYSTVPISSMTKAPWADR